MLSFPRDGVDAINALVYSILVMKLILKSFLDKLLNVQYPQMSFISSQKIQYSSEWIIKWNIELISKTDEFASAIKKIALFLFNT